MALNPNIIKDYLTDGIGIAIWILTGWLLYEKGIAVWPDAVCLNINE